MPLRSLDSNSSRSSPVACSISLATSTAPPAAAWEAAEDQKFAVHAFAAVDKEPCKQKQNKSRYHLLCEKSRELIAPSSRPPSARVWISPSIRLCAIQQKQRASHFQVAFFIGWGLPHPEEISLRSNFYRNIENRWFRSHCTPQSRTWLSIAAVDGRLWPATRARAARRVSLFMLAMFFTGLVIEKD